MISKEKYNKIKDIVTVIALCIILVVSIVLLYKALGFGNNSMLSNQTNSYTISINDKYSNLSGKVEFITINSSEHDYNIEYVTDNVLKWLNSFDTPEGDKITNIKIEEFTKNNFKTSFNLKKSETTYITYQHIAEYSGYRYVSFTPFNFSN